MSESVPEMEHSRFISLHRNQINPQPMPKSTLTFANGKLRYGKWLSLLTALTAFQSN